MFITLPTFLVSIYEKTIETIHERLMLDGQKSSFLFLNASNVSTLSVTETDEETETTKWDNREIARIIHVIVRPTGVH